MKIFITGLIYRKKRAEVDNSYTIKNSDTPISVDGNNFPFAGRK